MSLYNIISNGLDVLETNKKDFYDNSHEYSFLRDFTKGLGSQTNILALKSDKPNTIIVSCKKDTKIDDYYLKRLKLVSIERHDKESLYIEFNMDVSHLVEQSNQLPNFDKAYKLSKSGGDILKALGGWRNLYSFYILDENIFVSIEDVTLLHEGILQGYGAKDTIIFDHNRIRINMGEVAQYITKPIETAIVKDFFRTACQYMNALGGRSNIGRMIGDITHISFSINNMDLVNEEELRDLNPVNITSDERHYTLYLGQCTDLFAKILNNLNDEDIQKTLIDHDDDSLFDNQNIGIGVLERVYTKECKEACSIYAPITGTIVRLSSVNDEVFSKHVLGSGVAIQPTGDTLYAPFDGEISLSKSMKHALYMKSPCGITVLLHVGLNTIHSNSEYFDVLVNNQQIVKKGDPLLKFELKKLQDTDVDTVIPVVISKSNNLTMKGVKYNEQVTASEEILFTLS